MSVDNEIGDAVGLGVHPLIVVVAFWKFGETGREIVDTVERHQVKIRVGGRSEADAPSTSSRSEIVSLCGERMRSLELSESMRTFRAT